MDLVVGARKVIIAMEHTAKGAPKLLTRCTLPLTASQQVNMVVTEMGVIQITAEGMELTEIAQGYTVEEIQAATQARLIISTQLKTMPLPVG
jgi:acetate CoA/acetoacetate CoA-transferase beta subunit